MDKKKKFGVKSRGFWESVEIQQPEDDSPINWKEIYTEYKGKWVALEDDEQTVIAYGDTAKEALAESRRKGFENPIITLMPSGLTPFVG